MEERQGKNHNPYKAWRGACEAFSRGAHGNCRPFRPRAGDKSLQDYCDDLANAQVKSIKQQSRGDVAESSRVCIRFLKEISEGESDNHGSHADLCRFTKGKGLSPRTSA